ncbi:hypothetical protein FKM82_027772 [Ascaphus truei]
MKWMGHGISPHNAIAVTTISAPEMSPKLWSAEKSAVTESRRYICPDAHIAPALIKPEREQWIGLDYKKGHYVKLLVLYRVLRNAGYWVYGPICRPGPGYPAG